MTDFDVIEGVVKDCGPYWLNCEVREAASINKLIYNNRVSVILPLPFETSGPLTTAERERSTKMLTTAWQGTTIKIEMNPAVQLADFDGKFRSVKGKITELEAPF